MWDQRKYEDNLAISRASNSEIAEATKRMMAERDEWKQRAETAEARLAATRSPGSTGVWMHMDKYQELLTAIERYGADQWRRGNAGKDPQEFEEWRREQP